MVSVHERAFGKGYGKRGEHWLAYVRAAMRMRLGWLVAAFKVDQGLPETMWLPKTGSTYLPPIVECFARTGTTTSNMSNIGYSGTSYQLLDWAQQSGRATVRIVIWTTR